MLSTALRLIPVLHALGAIIALFALTMAFPLIWSHAIGDGAVRAYDISMLITLTCGAALWFATRTRHRRRELQPKDGFLLVTLVWTVLPAFATLPLLLYLPDLSFTDAYFEAMSGLTTTGATVLTDLDKLPDSINIWRGVLVLVGGLGVVVLAVAILPLLGVGGSQCFKAESAGPIKDDKLTPRIAETAKGLWLIYGVVAVLCMLSFKFAGMTWADAVMHACSTMGLGGFSSHDASFGYFNSPLIEAITIIFMLFAGINFAQHFLALRKRSAGVYLRDAETMSFLAVAVGGVLLVAAFLYYRGTYADFLTCLRHAAFNVISIATTTGFATEDFNQWPIFAPVFMLFLCCFTTCAGSTGGGIKMIRAVLMAKQAYRELVRIVHPRAVVPVKFGGRIIENNIIFAVLAFMLVYGGTVIGLTMLLAASGLDIITAFTAIVATVNNTGPGLNQVGPSTTYAVLTDFQTWVCTIAMLMGRLELLTVLVLFTPAFWKR